MAKSNVVHVVEYVGRKRRTAEGKEVTDPELEVNGVRWVLHAPGYVPKGQKPQPHPTKRARRFIHREDAEAYDGEDGFTVRYDVPVEAPASKGKKEAPPAPKP